MLNILSIYEISSYFLMLSTCFLKCLPIFKKNFTFQQIISFIFGDANEGGFPDGGSTSMRIGTDSDYSRVIVAGAGGGACNRNGYINQGGFGGGLTGGNCYHEGVLIENTNLQLRSWNTNLQHRRF